jgi:2-polyprenyl-3-methyl-5-hydroxy-6-metoxy-1,4-benzoquinol methylase
MDINNEVKNLLKSKKYYFSLKRKVNKNYWSNKKDPDGFKRDRLNNFEDEKKRFLKNNQSLIKIINSLKFNSICDVGCGPGYLISKINCKSKYGIENDTNAIKSASNFGQIYNVDLNKKFNIKKKFDLVVCYHVIEHMKNPLILINSIKKILKKNGLLIMGTPDFDSAMARLFKNRYRLLHDKTHISLFSLDSIMRMLRESEFKINLVDFPYFETEYFNKKNILKIFSKNKVSPPFYGSFVTIVCQKK